MGFALQVHQQLGQVEREKDEEQRARLSTQSQLARAEEDLEQERERVGQLEGELVTHTLIKEGLSRDLEKVCPQSTPPPNFEMHAKKNTIFGGCPGEGVSGKAVKNFEP